MYKFTNGIVVFDEEMKKVYLKAGFKLVEEEKKEEKVEDNEDNRVIQTKSKTSKRIPD